MPAPRGSAAFEPIPPDLDLDALVEETPNFKYADRIPYDQILIQGIEQFEKLVHLHVIQAGKPLVIEGFNNHLDQWTFSTQWLRDNLGGKYEHARDLTKKENLPLSIGHYIDNMAMLANQFTPTTYKSSKQRLYLKDIDCPELWIEKLKEHIPSDLFYLNECTGQLGGPGSSEERNPSGMGSRKGLGIGRAGDLMSSLPPHMRAENMMCYIGHEGTYTPAHREMCASLGQNIMVECSGTVGEDGKPTKPGSAIWFMTETPERHLVSEYWLSTLGHDIEVESHFAQIMAWKQAPFTVYVVEQKAGDFILVPPLAPHQVWNRGTRTMKAAWNRTTVETLELALKEALPRARMVCRDEQYKNKAIVLFTLNKYSGLLKQIAQQRELARDHETLHGLSKGRKIKQLLKDFTKLFHLFQGLLLDESFFPQMAEKVELEPFDGNITCSYCRCNIFNRFLTCKQCVKASDDGAEDTYDICMECYAMGRSCLHLSKLSWVEQFPWKDLLQKHQVWRDQILHMSVAVANIPPTYDEALGQLELKTLAQVCQEQLKARPFKDISKESAKAEDESGSASDSVNDDGTLKKKPKKRRSEKWLREHLACHICCHRHPIWKMAICSQCSAGYCYGSLWRGFDTLPQNVMEDPYWTCPRCREICNCAKCKKNPYNVPHEPSSTIIGHDTRKFADPRSVESLVDFSCSNTHWLKKAGDDNDPRESRRLQRRMAEAHNAKSQDMFVDEDDEDHEFAAQPESATIDPSLLLDPSAVRDSDRLDAADGLMRKAARDALSAMEGLSSLEHDPQSFIIGAGLDLAPNGVYTHTAANGISYELPIPSAGVDTAQTPRHPTKGNEIEGDPKTGTKRKRRADFKQKLVSEAAGFVDDANRKFYESRTQKSLAEAKKTGCLTIARAAVTGESLVTCLRLPSDKLRQFHTTTKSTVTQTGSGQYEDGPPVAIVTSDLPKEDSRKQAASRDSHIPKKRMRGEIDNDFSTRKQPGPKKKTAGAGVTSGPSKTSGHAVSNHAPAQERAKIQAAEPMVIGDAETSDGSAASSGEESETFYDADEVVVTPKKNKGRSLPAYLARRSPAPEDPPRELADSSSKRATPSMRPTNIAPLARMTVSSRPPPPTSLPLSDDGIANAAKNLATPSKGLDTVVSDNAQRQAGGALVPEKSPNGWRVVNTKKMSEPGLSAAELNRRAKMRAAAGEDSMDDDSDDSLIDRRAGASATAQPLMSSPASTPASAARKRGRPRKMASMNGSPPLSNKAQASNVEPRKSIFSKTSRGGKIKIVSARKA